MRILIAEDDAVSGMVLLRRVQKMGHDATIVGNGREAWEVYLREHPPLVITDWMMPEMNGLELVRKIRGEHREQYTYVIMLTALAGKAHYLEGMEAGADDFVTKPVDTDGLHARMVVAERVLNLQREVARLEGLLPICSYCKRIRDPQEQWHAIESYVSERTETTFETELCPDCQMRTS
jgi:DNA-binding response OmpR family regulator